MRVHYEPNIPAVKTKKRFTAKVTPKRKGPRPDKYLLPSWQQIKRSIKKGR